jgi:hypothetical protein
MTQPVNIRGELVAPYTAADLKADLYFAVRYQFSNIPARVFLLDVPDGRVLTVVEADDESGHVTGWVHRDLIRDAGSISRREWRAIWDDYAKDMLVSWLTAGGTTGGTASSPGGTLGHG